MEKWTLSRRVRQWTSGALAAWITLAAGAPGVFADPPSRRTQAARSAPVRDRAVVIALGATRGDAQSGRWLQEALLDAVPRHPPLQLPGTPQARPTLVLTFNVRSLTVQRGPAGPLVRCDVGVVVADGSGAVRAMMDLRRVLRGSEQSTDEALSRTALGTVADGALRDLLVQMVP